jgi:hypothetical protein
MHFFSKRVRGDVTGAVASDKVRARGFKPRQRRVISLYAGTELFMFDPSELTRIYVGEHGGDGSHHLLGVDRQGVVVSLAKFATLLGAQRAHARVAKFAGFGGGSLLKWLIGLTVGYLVLQSAFSGAQQAATHVAAADASMQLVQRNLAAPAAPQSAETAAVTPTFDAHEPSLDELAALAGGGYKFQPKLQVPQVDAPTLNCAQK